MIISGTRGREVHIGGGEFNCPRCNCTRAYHHKQIKRYFTLYFIPLFPIGTAGAYIECQGCSGTYAPEILTYDPEAEREQNAATMRRLSVLFLLDVKRCTSKTLKGVQDVVSDAFNIDIQRDDIAKDVQQAQSASPDTLQFFKTQTGGFSEEGKMMIISSLRQILETECSLQEHERNRLIEVGKAMGLRAKNVTQSLDSFPDEG